MRILLVLFVLSLLSSCAGPRYEMELRVRILEERMKILDAKVDSSLKERR